MHNIHCYLSLVYVDVTVTPADVWITHTEVHSGGSVSFLLVKLDIAQPGRLDESDEPGKPEVNEPNKPGETDGCQRNTIARHYYRL